MKILNAVAGKAALSALVAWLTAIAASDATAALPRTLHYQGYVTSAAGVPVNGTVPATFRIYDVASGGTALWSEGPLPVNCDKGVFSVVLGNSTPIALPFDAPYYLGVSVGADDEMTPRQPLSASPYALRSAVADAVPANAPLRIGTDNAATCDAGSSGSVRWNTALSALESCDGSAWKALATAAAAVTSHQLSVTRTAGGTVTSSPPGVYCGATCASSVPSGTVVTLSATPDAGASFSGWSGACSGSGSCSVTMDAAKSVSASFGFPLTVTKSGTGSGVVTNANFSINCGTTCAGSFPGGSLVTLTATPGGSSSFDGWSGACFGSGSCAVTLEQAKTVVATFSTLRNNLAVTRVGAGDGRVTSTPGGVDCGALCIGTFDLGALVSLNASALPGSSFAGWTGACSGTGSCSVNMNASQSVTATFSPTSYLLTVNRTGSGIVASSPAGIYCGVSCQGAFPALGVVTLTAVADPGSTFVTWTGDCSGSATTCLVTMSAARSVGATFSP